MKKFVVNIFFFFGIIAIVDFSVGQLGHYLQTHAKGGETRQFNDLVKIDTHDVLILGSSRAHHHYDTPYISDTLGIDVYNAGVDGNGVVLAYGILEMVLNRYKPRLIVFDVEPAFDISVYAADNNHTRYISRLKPYYRENGIGKIIQDVSQDEWWKVQSGLMRYNTSIITIMMDYFLSKSEYGKGYYPLKGAMQKEPGDSANGVPKVDQFKIDYIEKMIRLCQQCQVPLVLVASPKYASQNSDVYAPVKAFCGKYSVPFLDYYSDQRFMSHKELFKEQMHLNNEGARVFSSIIAHELTRFLDGCEK